MAIFMRVFESQNIIKALSLVGWSDWLYGVCFLLCFANALCGGYFDTLFLVTFVFSLHVPHIVLYAVQPLRRYKVKTTTKYEEIRQKKKNSEQNVVYMCL